MDVITPEFKSRKRLRNEKSAIEYLSDHLELPHKRRQKARLRIRSSLRPLLEAKKIIKEFHLGTSDAHPLDNSDVQELRIKLLRRDLTLCPEQVDWLNRLESRIAKKDITLREFKNEAAMLLEMVNSLPEQHRKDEFEYRRNDPLSAQTPNEEKPPEGDFVYLGKYRWREGTLYRRIAPQVAA